MTDIGRPIKTYTTKPENIPIPAKPEEVPEKLPEPEPVPEREKEPVPA